MAASKPTIAIIGSGYENLLSDNETALTLWYSWAGFTVAHGVDLTKYNVAVCSPIRTVQYTPLLASAAAGMFNFRSVVHRVMGFPNVVLT